MEVLRVQLSSRLREELVQTRAPGQRFQQGWLLGQGSCRKKKETICLNILRVLLFYWKIRV